MDRESQKIRALNNDLVKYYEIQVSDFLPLSKKTYKFVDRNGNVYFLKETDFNTLEKYQFLNNQGVNNVLFPLVNSTNTYVTRSLSHAFYINNFYANQTIVPEVKIQNMFKELDKLHTDTSFNRQLNPNTSRPKFEEITNRLDYRFKLFENFVRSVEAKPLNIYSMPVLSNYQYLLDSKKELVRLQKRIISSIKARESIEYSFIHNHPQVDHLLNIRGVNYLTSVDHGKIGINSLDMAKFYVENEDYNIDFKTLIMQKYSHSNPFYYDYCRYMILLIYINRLNLSSDDYVNAQTFINQANGIQRYFNNFKDFDDLDPKAADD